MEPWDDSVTPEDERLRELCEAATDGPWETPLANIGKRDECEVRSPDGAVVYQGFEGDGGCSEADAAFIAAARSAVPELLTRAEAAQEDYSALNFHLSEELTAAQAELERYRALLEAFVDAVEHPMSGLLVVALNRARAVLSSPRPEGGKPDE